MSLSTYRAKSRTDESLVFSQVRGVKGRMRFGRKGGEIGRRMCSTVMYDARSCAMTRNP